MSKTIKTGLMFTIDPKTRKQILKGDMTILHTASNGLLGHSSSLAIKIHDICNNSNEIISLKKRSELADELGKIFSCLSKCAIELRYNIEMIADIDDHRIKEPGDGC